ncbi:methylated-DNA--[protein]-cysteine S-methyltransferase [Oceanobacillus bengalensis]|uniref:Methylated-DNA--protein-cysteine methyltransferase n=1 Tax=Oceanobacillus bengalensis TaxID=1435466 RepID=A0A494Z890_9BACI|nr:methylated-DNA--[protein]-cysteine S-methyltransferase [Oceanobacillus bengalensis]RKQ18747.1 methylated-DNA--[protein]-cysteine S-methyltransferase [Oceanobacillus bengalensis]
MELYYDEMDSPVGKLLLISSRKKLVRIDYGSFSESKEEVSKWIHRYIPNARLIRSTEALYDVRNQLERYFSQKSAPFNIEMELYGTPFQKKVWQALYDSIPYGETKSYKDIARLIGNPKAVRAVGGAVNKNPFSIIIPCHRVIGASGKMVGYNGGLDKKEFLLQHEGII